MQISFQLHRFEPAHYSRKLCATRAQANAGSVLNSTVDHRPKQLPLTVVEAHKT